MKPVSASFVDRLGRVPTTAWQGPSCLAWETGSTHTTRTHGRRQEIGGLPFLEGDGLTEERDADDQELQRLREWLHLGVSSSESEPDLITLASEPPRRDLDGSEEHTSELQSLRHL